MPPVNPYSSVSVSGYAAVNPPDDGSQVAANRVTWVGIRSNLTNPLNIFASAVDAAILSAFGSLVITTDSNEESVVLAAQEFM